MTAYFAARYKPNTVAADGNRKRRRRRHEGDVGEAGVEQKVETETEQQSDADLQSLG